MFAGILLKRNPDDTREITTLHNNRHAAAAETLSSMDTLRMLAHCRNTSMTLRRDDANLTELCGYV